MGSVLQEGNYKGLTTEQIASIVKNPDTSNNKDDTLLWISGIALVIAILSLFNKKITSKYKMYQYVIIIVLLITTYTLYLNKSKFGKSKFGSISKLNDFMTAKGLSSRYKYNGFNMYFDTEVVNLETVNNINDIFTSYTGPDTLIAVVNCNNNNTVLDMTYGNEQISIPNKNVFIGKLNNLNISKPLYIFNDTLSIYVGSRIQINEPGIPTEMSYFLASWVGFDSPLGTIYYNYIRNSQTIQFENINTILNNRPDTPNMRFYYENTLFSDIDTVTTLDGGSTYLNSKGINDIYVSIYNYTDIDLPLVKWVYLNSNGQIIGNIPTGEITVTDSSGKSIQKTFTQIPDLTANGGEYKYRLTDFGGYTYEGNKIMLLTVNSRTFTNPASTRIEWVAVPGLLVTDINNNEITVKNLIQFSPS